jgi:hypothetical protein
MCNDLSIYLSIILSIPCRLDDKNWAAPDTETRFETESDVMELCDLAEIL